MKRLRSVVVLGVGLLLSVSALLAAFPITPAYSEISPELIFTEIKIRNDTLGYDEFIEIHNPGDQAVLLNDFLIAYINNPAPADSAQFTSAAISDGLLSGGASLILAQNEQDSNLLDSKSLPFSSLSDSGGTLRILGKENKVIDQFSWASTQSLAIAPVHYLPNNTATKSQSFTRSADENGIYNIVDPGWMLITPSPQSSELLPAPVPEPEQEPVQIILPETPLPDISQPEQNPENETPVESNTPEDNSTPLLPPQITELLPNPAAPASDNTDEYIEIYNPNSQPFSLEEYQLQTGTSFNYSHVFQDTVLAPGEYRAFYITDTDTILSNTAGQARLLDPQGVIVAQTNPYESADDGDAWIFINNAWQWTDSPTPNSANVLSVPPLKISKAATTASKKASVPKSATKPKASAKVASAKTSAAKKPAKAAAERAAYQEPDATEIAPVHPRILAGVGVITLVYAIYEYRHDAINRLHQFRRYREIRRAARTATEGQ